MAKHQYNEPIDVSAPYVDVVVCVHNALDDVQQCLDSLLLSDYPSERLRIILIDDGSESETAEFLRSFSAKKSRILLNRVSKATGYTRAANRGVRLSTAEIICLLNSDTIVPPGWLKKLIRYFSCDPYLGLVGPLSNAATWQSVPRVVEPDGRFSINELPIGLDIQAMDQRLEQAAKIDNVTPRVPLLNGFCMAVRRVVFEDIGDFDEQSFPKGYGEENDFCFRATDAGYSIALACDTYVYHAKSKSYGTKTRNDLSRAGSAAFKEKYSEARIKNAVESMRNQPTLKRLRDNLTSMEPGRGN